MDAFVCWLGQVGCRGSGRLRGKKKKKATERVLVFGGLSRIWGSNEFRKVSVPPHGYSPLCAGFVLGLFDVPDAVALLRLDGFCGESFEVKDVKKTPAGRGHREVVWVKEARTSPLSRTRRRRGSTDRRLLTSDGPRFEFV